MLTLLSLIVGLIGFGWAGWKDLKTTEFPDWIPYSMIAAALALRAAFSFQTGELSLLINSVSIGSAFLVFGLLLYYFRQWGDGDAWLLGALGFLYPDIAMAGILPFPVLLLFNFFFVAFLYILVYSVIIGMRSKETVKFFRKFRKDVKRIFGVMVVFTGGLVALFYFLALPMERFLFLFLFPPFLFFLLFFLHYGKFIEKNLFKRQVSVKALRVGDVPVGERWRVLDKKEIDALKKKGGKIWIKEGVRFAPVFFLTVVVLFLRGDLWSLLLSIVG